MRATIFMLLSLCSAVQFYAQVTYTVKELPFEPEMLRISWKSDTAAKARFDSIALSIAAVLENAYVTYRLGKCLNKGLEITYYAAEIVRSPKEMKKAVQEDHQKSGAAKLYKGLGEEKEQRQFLAEKRVRNYANMLIAEITRKSLVQKGDLKAESFIGRELMKSLILKIEYCSGCEDYIVIKSNFDSIYLKSPQQIDYWPDAIFPQELVLKDVDSYALNTLTPEEMELYHLIMDYRRSRGLPDIPISQSLNIVAKTHARDISFNGPYKEPCNLHSWSDSRPDLWEGCCYTDDHKYAHCVWKKPSELSNYKGAGYEIAFWITPVQCRAIDALRGWQGSPPHNACMINRGIWRDVTWNAVGIGIYRGFACVWFGKEKDEFEYEDRFLDLSKKISAAK
jgi:hypothetical protein